MRDEIANLREDIRFYEGLVGEYSDMAGDLKRDLANLETKHKCSFAGTTYCQYDEEDVCDYCGVPKEAAERSARTVAVAGKLTVEEFLQWLPTHAQIVRGDFKADEVSKDFLRGWAHGIKQSSNVVKEEIERWKAQ